MSHPSRDPDRLVLITGATGYIGGRLRRRLEEAGRPVRCLARDPARLVGRVAPDTEVVRGDVLDRPSLDAALRGVDAAFYLIHAMGDAGDFARRDREGATNFAAAAAAAGVRRIVYLGGLGDDRGELSPHLRSRNEVGGILRSSPVETLELRASIVLGSGSLSFEMIRSLVERLPVMVTPRWVRVQAQPIAVDDLLSYLIAALDHPPGDSRVYEVGGRDRVGYGDLMREYARQRGLRRIMLPVPVLTPWLSSLWLGLITPLYARIGRKLIQSIQHPTVVRDDAARRAFAVEPRGMREAIAAALAEDAGGGPETRWYDAVSSAGAVPTSAGVSRGGRLLDARSREVATPPARAFAPIRRIGGRRGWYAWNALWRLRGALDLLVGGVGLRRGRPDPETPRVGDALDFWRVEAYEPDRLLRLRAEMRLPGDARLEFAVEPLGAGAVIRQTAVFAPRGLLGLLYWYALYPVHQLVFAGMLRALGAAAEATDSAQADPADGRS